MALQVLGDEAKGFSDSIIGLGATDMCEAI